MKEAALAQQQKEMEGVTFKPNTEPPKGAATRQQRNASLNSSVRVSPQGVRREDLLIDYGRMVQEKKQRA